jgi:hypothetical protein
LVLHYLLVVLSIELRHILFLQVYLIQELIDLAGQLILFVLIPHILLNLTLSRGREVLQLRLQRTQLEEFSLNVELLFVRLLQLYLLLC